MREKRTILFFDDQRLNQRFNLERRTGKPELLRDALYQDPNADLAWSYPGVFRDRESGKFRMVYQGYCLERGRYVPLLAQSADGIHWAAEDTREQLALPDRLFPNQVMELSRFGELPALFVDERAAPEERLKAFIEYHTGKWTLSTRLMVSPDGIHWRDKEGACFQEKGPDPNIAAYWNDLRQCYMITTRPEFTDRRISLIETRDWLHFTQPELLLEADALDAPLTEPYGMPVLRYEGFYIGLLWLYHPAPEVQGHSPTKFHDGFVDCQLAYSLNGIHFQRFLREPFIGNGEPGEFTFGCVYPSSTLQAQDGSLLLYASACALEHGYRRRGCSAICTYRLRRDGFCYLQSAGGWGIAGTRALFWQGGEAQVNVQCPHGEVLMQLTDEAGKPLEGYAFQDCIPFSGDDTAWTPLWKNGRGISELAGRVLRIELRLRTGRLYALRGDFLPLVAVESSRFLDAGVLPAGRPGF